MEPMSVSPEQRTQWLRQMSRLSDLRPEKRLAAKVPMSSEAVTRRLRIQSRLRDACLRWQWIGAGLRRSGS